MFILAAQTSCQHGIGSTACPLPDRPVGFFPTRPPIIYRAAFFTTFSLYGSAPFRSQNFSKSFWTEIAPALIFPQFFRPPRRRLGSPPNLEGRSTAGIAPHRNQAMELNASDKHSSCAPQLGVTRIAFCWEKPLNTHTRRRTSLVWAGCDSTSCSLGWWLDCSASFGGSLSSQHSRSLCSTQPLAGWGVLWPLTLGRLWSLFVQQAGGLQPAHRYAPQAYTAHLVLAIAPQTLRTLTLRCDSAVSFALPIQIQLAHTHGACSALMLNRCPLPAQGRRGLTNESRWLVAPLPLCGFTLQRIALPVPLCCSLGLGHAR